MKSPIELVEEFASADNNRKFATPDGAEGRCYGVSVRLGFWLMQHGMTPTLIYALGDIAEHYALEHEGVVYDLTYRQFDWSVPYPLVETTEEWIERTDEELDVYQIIREDFKINV